MAAAFLVVALIEWAASRDFELLRAEPAPVHPVVEAAPVSEPAEEPESFGWTAFEEAQEPSDAMTMIGAPAVEENEVAEESVEEPVPVEDEAEEHAQPESEPEQTDEPPHEKRRRWWKRHAESDAAEAASESERPPRHVRVLQGDVEGEPAPADDLDPWERGFDDAALEPDAEADPAEDTAEGEPAFAADREDADQHSH